MKKILSLVLAFALAFTALAFASCGETDDKTIRVGASPSPHAEILAVAKDVLADQGYTLEIVEFNDYIIPNTSVESGELDANYFQHIPYLNSFNEENGTHLVSVLNVHYEPLGIYAGKTSSLAELQDGATIAIPNDTTNEARALLLLEANGLITLREGAGLNATVLDIESNPHNYDIQELVAEQVPLALPDVDIAVINGNYALTNELGEALVYESADSDAAETYINVLVVKEGNENLDKIQALVEALSSDEVREYIVDTFGEAVVPVF
ncbi:MAG: metal ABC transporter substrate-binding protein [Clostridiales bacterium]|nr:MAG: metal ABC transporter substrate-binding protein [Clostridiales bacterium]